MPGTLTPLANPEQAQRALSWGEVDWMVEVAVAHMRNRKYHPSKIIPIGGGGIIPAAILAYRFYKKDGLPVELMAPVYARSYGIDHKQHQLKILFPDDIERYDSYDTLFVDDIVDTGRTLEAIQAVMPRSACYALVTKIDGQPNWFTTLDRENQWWIFPWEKEVPPGGPNSKAAA